eukprot:scaffold18705_cov113-Cylindrotheca_fusiformis.AAC.1
MQRLKQQQQQQQQQQASIATEEVQGDTIASLSVEDRNYCRIVCYSNTVIGNVLPYLGVVPTAATAAAGDGNN